MNFKVNLMRVEILATLVALVALTSASKPPTVVLDLNEKFVEVMNDGFWIVKFFAPWCAHCKRLAPTWEHLGHALQDRNLPVRVAKMDCTRFPSACTSLEIRGYPSIIFFRNGRRVDYNGDRTKEALLSFAIKSSAAVVEQANAVRINEIRRESRNDPSFLIIGEQQDEMLEKFEAVADELFSKTRFFSARPESVPAAMRESGARVVVFKDDLYVPYQEEASGLRKWVMQERWPLLPRTGQSNLGDMSTTGKYLVLAVVTDLDRFNASSPVGVFYDKVARAAADMRKAEHLWDQFQFGWMDGADIASSIVMGALEPPAILVFNYSAYEFFLSNDDVSQMTPQSILTWLDELAESIAKGTAQPMGGRAWTTRVHRMAYELYSNVSQMFATQPLLSSCLFGVPIAFLSIICYSICSADFSVDRDEFYPEEDEEELMDEQEEGNEDGDAAYVPDPDHPKNE